jgi:hypothetical protein
MSAYLVVTLSVFASATATLTLNLLARLDWRRVRAWTRPAVEDAPAEPGQLLEARQGACGCLTIAGAVALLHEQGYLPVGQLGSGGELLANGEAAAIWPAPPDRIAAVQFGTLTLGPAHQQPATHLDATALLAASRSHRTTLTNRPAPDPATQPGCSSRSTRWVTRRRHSMAAGPPRHHRPPPPRTHTLRGRRCWTRRVALASIRRLEYMFDNSAMWTWEAHDPSFSRPLAAPLERCAELLGVDLATLRTVAAEVEPYIRVDGTKVWSLMQLERRLRPDAYGRVRGGYLSRRRARTKRA